MPQPVIRATIISVGILSPHLDMYGITHVWVITAYVAISIFKAFPFSGILD